MIKTTNTIGYFCQENKGWVIQKIEIPLKNGVKTADKVHFIEQRCHPNGI